MLPIIFWTNCYEIWLKSVLVGIPRWVLIVLLLFQICLRDVVLSLLTINKLMLLSIYFKISDDLLNIANPYFEQMVT